MGGWSETDNRAISVQLNLTGTATGTELGNIIPLFSDENLPVGNCLIHVIIIQGTTLVLSWLGFFALPHTYRSRILSVTLDILGNYFGTSSGVVISCL